MKPKPTVYVIPVTTDDGALTRLVVGCYDLAEATARSLAAATNVTVGSWNRPTDEVPERDAAERTRARNLIALIAAPVNLPVRGGQS